MDYQFIPSNFFIMISPNETEIDKSVQMNFKLLTRNNMNTFQTICGGKYINLIYSKSTKLYSYKDNTTIFILHGEIYEKNDISKKLLDIYTNYGEQFTNHLNGSFVLVVIDSSNEKVLLITDRINSKKLFHEKIDDINIFYTSLYLKTKSVFLDYNALASFIVNNCLINNRTLFSNIKVLERANVYKIASNKLLSYQYWQYKFTNEYSSRKIKQLEFDLSDLLIESVKKRVTHDSKIFLSLSGGYDSSAILGILAHLKVDDVKCFSYKYGSVKHDSDEYISHQMANSLNYTHKYIDTYEGDIFDIFQINADLGQGLSYSDDARVWKELSIEFNKSHQSMLFLGQHVFGWTDGIFSNNKEILNSLDICYFSDLLHVERYMEKEFYQILNKGLHEDINQILSRCPPSNDVHDIKDVIYLEQRVSNFILNWRENFNGNFTVYCNPFLDNSILDFMEKIPSSLRRGKYLFIKTTKKMFPGLFKYPRAMSASCYSYLPHAIIHNKEALIEYINSHPSILDNIISPNIYPILFNSGLKLLNPDRIQKKVYLKLKNKMSQTRFKRLLWARKKFTKSYIDEITMLKRLLLLRIFLDKFEIKF